MARARTLTSRAGGSIVLSNHASGKTTYSGTRLTSSCSDHDMLIRAAKIANTNAARGSHGDAGIQARCWVRAKPMLAAMVNRNCHANGLKYQKRPSGYPGMFHPKRFTASQRVAEGIKAKRTCRRMHRIRNGNTRSSAI